ncbi:MAG: hypothetical protein ACYCSF_00620 [Acidimicrobiales bacterium]
MTLRGASRATPRLVELSSAFLDRHLSRRSFIVRSTFAASALVVVPKRYVLQPGSAYEAFCGPPCGSGDCSCASRCCAGFSTFCCTVNGGYNYCPEGSFVGGWWAAADSSLCGNGTRYYLDCNGTCHCEAGCGDYLSNGGTFCDSACDGLDCHCQGGSCDNWVESCFQFRYGQCHTDVGCSGRIVCRIVSCVEPWKLDLDCGTTYMWDSATAEMNAPCNTKVPQAPPPPCDSPATRCETVAIASPRTASGYWLATSYGKVFGFGAVKTYGDLVAGSPPGPVVAMQASFSGAGYWLADSRGNVFNFGDAPFYGSAINERLPHPITAMAVTPTGEGYWLARSDGGIYFYGDAAFYGSLAGRQEVSPVVGIDSTATGAGYWFVTADGTVYAFGDAVSYGSPVVEHPAYPVVGVRRSVLGAGYYVVGAKGAVWAYGDATRLGEPYGHVGRWDAVGIALSPPEGYWVCLADGSIFSYGTSQYHGGANS